MFINNTFFTNQFRINFVLVIMAIIMLVLPIFKGGNFPGVMSVFIFTSAIIFIASIPDLIYSRDKYWLLVWLVFSFAVLLHAFIYPFYFVNERFFVDGLSPQIAEKLNFRQLSKMRMIEVWSFFTSMWLFAWRVSLFELKHIKILFLILFFISIFQAFFGVVHFISGASTVMGLWVKEFYLNDATGTFVNRNHFAGMLAICSPMVLSGMLMPKPLIFPSLSQGYRVVLSFLYLVVLVLALISSHSRMGMVAAIFGLVVSYFLMNNLRNQSQQKSNLLKLLGVSAFLCLFAVWFGFDDILKRYTDLGDGNSRFDVWQSMFMNMPFSVWLFGAGPGSFEHVFQIIKPSNFSVRFVYAHNDYFEFMFEFGLLLSLLIMGAVFLWVKHFHSKCDSYVKAGVYGTFAAVGLHSLVDFNLQIPASALFFWFAVGMLANPVVLKGSESQNIKPKKKMKKASLALPKNKRELLEFLRSD